MALMVLAHQTQMHNWITLTNYQTRIELYKQTAGGRPAADSDEAPKKFERPAEQLVRYLLFTNEMPLATPIAGTSDFADSSRRGDHAIR